MHDDSIDRTCMTEARYTVFSVGDVQTKCSSGSANVNKHFRAMSVLTVSPSWQTALTEEAHIVSLSHDGNVTICILGYLVCPIFSSVHVVFFFKKMAYMVLS